MSVSYEKHADHYSVKSYQGKASFVNIPATHKGLPVTELLENCFRENDAIEAVMLPDSIKHIGAHAFAGCNNLTYVGRAFTSKNPPLLSNLPAGLRTIGDFAFACADLACLEFTGVSLDLGRAAFFMCRRLRFVRMPNCSDFHPRRDSFFSSGLKKFYLPAGALPLGPDDCSPDPDRASEKLANKLVYWADEDPTHAMDDPTKPPVAHAPTIDFLEEDASISFFAGEDLDLMDTLDLDDSLDDLLARHKDEVNAKSPEVSDAVEEEVDSAADDSVLFTLHLRQPAQKNSALGHFIPEGEEIRFISKSGFGSSEQKSLTVEITQNRPALRQILKVLADRNTDVRLEGRRGNRCVHITELKPESGALPHGISSDFFMKLLEMDKPDCPRIRIRESKEARFFFDAFRDTLPEWVVYAFERNLELSGKGGIEDRRHAVHALDLLGGIDWTKRAPDVADAVTIKQQLDNCLYGLENVKRRIMEITAKIRRGGGLPKWGILLNGPAGIGKTTLAKVIADALHMPLIELDIPSVGKNPEVISGSSRIYSNAREGAVVSGMYRAGSSSAVVLVNELDKLPEGSAVSDVLLSLLDRTGMPENFLEEVIPTDNLFCIGTCNDLSRISGPMRDRFLIVNLPGYTTAEKKEIWNRHVFPKVLRASSVETDKLLLEDAALNTILSDYALEPGVRDLERIAESITGDFCLENELDHIKTHKTYTEADIHRMLGRSRRVRRAIINEPGTVYSALFTNGVPRLFPVETSIVSGTGKFEVMGPMPSIQHEYAKIAYMSLARNTGVDMSRLDVTIFVPDIIPEGSKNNIGLACYTAMYCKLKNLRLPLGDVVFIGGCDLNGTLYLNPGDGDGTLDKLADNGIKYAYIPTGGQFAAGSESDSLMIVEAYNVKDLMEIMTLQAGALRAESGE